MKIRIVGACGSGKTYAAMWLSKLLGISFYETDNIIWNRKVNSKRTLHEREQIFTELLKEKDWIIEGAQYKWSSQSFSEADLIIILNTNSYIRDFRVLFRFLKMQFGIGKYHYKQSLADLADMLKQNKEYDKFSYMRILEVTNQFHEKRIIVKSLKEVESFLKQWIWKLQCSERSNA